MEDTLISPKTEKNIRKKVLLKNRSPHFRDILRERFKLRIKENRRKLFDEMRKLNTKDEAVSTVSGYLQSEMEYVVTNECSLNAESMVNADDSYDLENDVEWSEKIWDEFLQEQVQWICTEMEKEELHYDELRSDHVLCPLCQLGPLRQEHADVICSCCNVHLTSVSLDQLNTDLKIQVDIHSNNCNEAPQFSLFQEPDLSGLFMICHRCAMFNKII